MLVRNTFALLLLILGTWVLAQDPDITAMEYYIDTDPGVGAGTTIPVTAAAAVDVNFTIPTGSLSPGFHNLVIRAQDQNGLWSIQESRPFFIATSSPTTTANISAVEYYIDTDPGFGNGTPVAITAATTQDLNIAVPTGSLSEGFHTLHFRSQDSDGQWSIFESKAFYVNVVPNWINVEYYIDTDPGVGAGTVTAISPPTSNVNVNLTIPTGSLSDGSHTLNIRGQDENNLWGQPRTVTFDVCSPLVADAGSDIAICPGDVVNLTGTITTGTAISQTWSTSGTGTFDDNTILTPIYTPSAADESSGSVTLTLLADATSPCPQASSTINITITQPIDAVAQTLNIDLGQTQNVDVFNGGTFGTGDVLTTTITQQPTKGSATILSDGTIDYTPNASTVGADMIGFEICNQCALCDTDFINVDITNEPPVITPTPSNITAGGVVTIDILATITDLNDNLDLSTLAIVQQPASGAPASFDASNNLVVDYTGLTFAGTDQVGIEVCDLSASCTIATFSITVDPIGITIFNGVSPNGDNAHDFFEIVNIELFSNNEVKIFNRWGDTVFETSGYDNQSNNFSGVANVGAGNELPDGTYYYTIQLNNGEPAFTGFLVLSRQ